VSASITIAPNSSGRHRQQITKSYGKPIRRTQIFIFRKIGEDGIIDASAGIASERNPKEGRSHALRNRTYIVKSRGIEFYCAKRFAAPLIRSLEVLFDYQLPTPNNQEAMNIFELAGTNLLDQGV
jgi:hypothetical protein